MLFLKYCGLRSISRGFSVFLVVRVDNYGTGFVTQFVEALTMNFGKIERLHLTIGNCSNMLVSSFRKTEFPILLYSIVLSEPSV